MTPSPSRDQGEAGGGRGRRISLFGKSRSDDVMVAVGLSPRNNGGERVRVAERRLNRIGNRSLQASLRDARFLRSLPAGSVRVERPDQARQERGLQAASPSSRPQRSGKSATSQGLCHAEAA